MSLNIRGVKKCSCGRYPKLRIHELYFCNVYEQRLYLQCDCGKSSVLVPLENDLILTPLDVYFAFAFDRDLKHSIYRVIHWWNLYCTNKN